MFAPTDLALQLDLAFRLVLAAVLGALVGLERELHAHPAGMRTHLLVSFGSALFTVLSIYGFVGVLDPSQGSPPDPTRIAAQVVTGIGFLGAGAIIKYGTSIRGLTTAGSLWATAALGMAAGAGQVVIAVTGCAIVLFSLWPLNWIIDRLHIGKEQMIRLRVHVANLDALTTITRELSAQRIELSGIETQRIGKGRYEIELDLRPPPHIRSHTVVELVSALPDVELIESASVID